MHKLIVEGKIKRCRLKEGRAVRDLRGDAVRCMPRLDSSDRALHLMSAGLLSVGGQLEEFID